jgi:hypothetical protein
MSAVRPRDHVSAGNSYPHVEKAGDAMGLSPLDEIAADHDGVLLR